MELGHGGRGICRVVGGMKSSFRRGKTPAGKTVTLRFSQDSRPFFSFSFLHPRRGRVEFFTTVESVADAQFQSVCTTGELLPSGHPAA